jgi:SAM-dependent methyltransferase
MATAGKRAEYFPGFEIREEDTVVDVGCGGGDAVVFAGNLGAEVVGTDYDPLVIERLDERMRGVPARSYRGFVSDSDPLPLPDAHADVVICTEVAEHVPDPARFLAELARIGKPGARYLITVPDPRSESVMETVAPQWYWEEPYHLRVYRPEQLDQFLGKAGLVVEDRQSLGFYWSMWWLLRMAMDPKPLEPNPEDGPTRHWEEVWTALGQTAKGARLAGALDEVLPKSQVRIARKARVDHGHGKIPAASQAGFWTRCKRRLRSNQVRFGGLDLKWELRRSPR